MVDIKALTPFPVDIHGKLGVAGIPFPFFPGGQLEDDALAGKFLGQGHLCPKPEPGPVPAPQVGLRHIFPAVRFHGLLQRQAGGNLFLLPPGYGDTLRVTPLLQFLQQTAGPFK